MAQALMPRDPAMPVPQTGAGPRIPKPRYTPPANMPGRGEMRRPQMPAMQMGGQKPGMSPMQIQQQLQQGGNFPKLGQGPAMPQQANIQPRPSPMTGAPQGPGGLPVQVYDPSTPMNQSTGATAPAMPPTFGAQQNKVVQQSGLNLPGMGQALANDPRRQQQMQMLAQLYSQKR